MRTQTTEQALQRITSLRRAGQQTSRRLTRAKALLRETAYALHNLPEQDRPAELIERVRLFLHRDDAQPIHQEPTTP